MAADCLQLKMEIQGPRLCCRIEGVGGLEASKRALAELAAVQLRYQASQLLLINKAQLHDSPPVCRTQQFELGLYFSEWFRGVTVAIVGAGAGRDWDLICDTCRANALQIELFDQLVVADEWLLSQQPAPEPLSGSASSFLSVVRAPKAD